MTSVFAFLSQAILAPVAIPSRGAQVSNESEDPTNGIHASHEINNNVKFGEVRLPQWFKPPGGSEDLCSWKQCAAR